MSALMFLFSSSTFFSSLKRDVSIAQIGYNGEVLLSLSALVLVLDLLKLASGASKLVSAMLRGGVLKQQRFQLLICESSSGKTARRCLHS